MHSILPLLLETLPIQVTKYLSGLDLGDVVHNIELQIVSAPAVARWASQPGGRVSPTL